MRGPGRIETVYSTVCDILDGWRVFRSAWSGQGGAIGSGRRTFWSMANAPGPTLVETEDGPQLHFLGADDRGIELHVVAVPDNRRDGGLAVIHAMPTSYTDSYTDREGEG